MGSGAQSARATVGRRNSAEGRMQMHLVEQHVIRKTDARFAVMDRAAFASKNLYNAANYLVRQAFIHEDIYLNYAAVFHRIKKPF
jgi:putative transposase